MFHVLDFCFMMPKNFCKIFCKHALSELTNSTTQDIISANRKNIEGVNMELTRSEMEIMDVLWETGKPLSRADLLEHTEEKTWKDSSVHILLNSLLQKEAIREAGLVKRGKTFGRVFAPTMTREEYFANTIFSHRHKPEPVGLFKALLKREEVTQADLQQLLELVQKEIR